MKNVPKRIDLDISGYDRSTIIWEVRSAYTLGYEEIVVTYRTEETAHLRRSERVNVRDLLNYISTRLLGMRIEFVGPKKCILRVPKSNEKESLADIDARVTKMMVELSEELLLLLKGHLYASQLIEEKHDSISKIVSYAKRIINLSPATPDRVVQHHIMAMMDKIADIVKYIGRDYTKSTRQVSKTTLTLFNHVHTCIFMYAQARGKFTPANISAFSIKRDDVKRFMRESLNALDSRETFMLGQATTIIEILIDMMEAEMSLKNYRG